MTLQLTLEEVLSSYIPFLRLPGIGLTSCNPGANDGRVKADQPTVNRLRTIQIIIVWEE
jgi:hypothetical protein